MKIVKSQHQFKLSVLCYQLIVSLSKQSELSSKVLRIAHSFCDCIQLLQFFKHHQLNVGQADNFAMRILFFVLAFLCYEICAKSVEQAQITEEKRQQIPSEFRNCFENGILTKSDGNCGALWVSRFVATSLFEKLSEKSICDF